MFGLFGNKKKVQRLSPAEFVQMYDHQKDVLIDVRTSQEFNSGHLKGAKHMDVLAGAFDKVPLKLPKDKRYFLYCRSGMRSGKASKKMLSQGYEKVFNIGGYDSLKGLVR